MVFVKLWNAETANDRVIDIMWGFTETHYPAQPIDWDNIFSQLDDYEYDNVTLETQGCEGSPAFIKIKQEILRRRRNLLHDAPGALEGNLLDLFKEATRQVVREEITGALTEIREVAIAQEKGYWYTSGNDTRSEALGELGSVLKTVINSRKEDN